MRRKRSLLHIVLLLIVFGPSQSHSQVTDTAGGITSKAVWAAPTEAWSKMQDECNYGERTGVECVLSIMRQSGASPEAIEFTRLLKGDGFMESFREMGRVDLASVFTPFRANSNQRFKLVNGSPQIIDVEGSIGENVETEIRNDRMYLTLVRKYPNLMLGGYPSFDRMLRLPAGGQQFIFKFQLVNGCRACSTDSYANVGYNFDGAGNFVGTKLVGMSKAQPVKNR